VAYRPDPGDLALHGTRVLGFPTAAQVASRYGLDLGATTEYLLDFEARGWVRQLSFAGTSGWSLTEAGQAENEQRLAAELDRAGARATVSGAHRAFLPLNERLGAACTNWQIRPTPADPMAFNEHTDWRWDDRVLRTLASVGTAFRGLCEELAGCLARFGGYPDRYARRWPGRNQGSAAGWTAPAGTPATWCGSSSAKTCWLPWAYHVGLS
jgi:hypothetical protein